MPANSQTFKVFVSSTFEDLKDHRAHVIRQLRRAGLFVDPMEDWTADTDEPNQFSQYRLEGCHLCLLLVAFRRGFIPDGETRSITQLEYESALNRGVEIFPFLLQDDAPWPHKFDELDKDPELNKWREQLTKSHGVEFYSLEPRSIEIGGAMGRWLAKQKPGNLNQAQENRLIGLAANRPIRGWNGLMRNMPRCTLDGSRKWMT